MAYETVENLVGCEPLFLAWVDDEKDIPPALLRYLKQKCNVRTGFPKTAGECFANHCEVIQGNWYLFEEVSPLAAFIPDGLELREKLSKLKLYSIDIDEDLVFDWNFGMGDNDELYLKYCSTNELILPPGDDEYITCADMYKE